MKLAPVHGQELDAPLRTTSHTVLPVAGSIAAICPRPVLTYITPFTTSGVAFMPLAVYGSSGLSGIFLIRSWSGETQVHATFKARKIEKKCEVSR